jgi:uncharacterized membrane protein YbhN (UPF0104 family)
MVSSSQHLGRPGLHSLSTALKSKGSLAYGAKLIVSAGGIWFVFHRYDLVGALPRLFEHGLGWLAIGLVILIAQTAVAAVRWHSILRALRLALPLWTVVQIFYVMAFLNSFVPAGLGGDALRVWLLRKDVRHIMTAVNSVLIDRIVVVFALLLAAAAAQPLLWLQVGNSLLVLAIGGGALAIVVAILAAIFMVPRLDWPVLGGLMPMLRTVSHDLRLVFLDGKALVTTLIPAFAGNLLLVAAAFVLAYGADIEVGFITWLVVMPVVLLVSALPISIGGWGTREIAMVYMLGLFAIPPDLAAAVSIQLGLCMTIASLVGAPVWTVLDQGRARPSPRGEP